jgi:hypothetical protein
MFDATERLIELKKIARRQIWLAAVVKGHGPGYRGDHEVGAAGDSGSGCLNNARDARGPEAHCAARVLQRVQPVLGNNRPARGTSQLHSFTTFTFP